MSHLVEEGNISPFTAPGHIMTTISRPLLLDEGVIDDIYKIMKASGSAQKTITKNLVTTTSTEQFLIIAILHTHGNKGEVVLNNPNTIVCHTV